MVAEIYDVAIRGLIRKRAEIAGRIDVLNDQLTDAMVQLDHVDATLRILDPDIQPEGIPSRAPVVAYAAIKGQTTRVILAMLRDHGPLTTQEIAEKLVEARKLNSADRNLVRTIHSRAASALRKLRERGMVGSANTGPNGLLAWKITKPDARLEGGWRNGSGG